MPLTRLETDADGVTVTWQFAATAEQVWAGLTEPDVLAAWLGTAVTADVKAGGRLVVDHGDGYRSTSDLRRADPPSRLDMTWEFPDEPTSQLSWHLAEVNDHCVLTLQHTGLGALSSSYGPGWVTHVTYLEAALAGQPLPRSAFLTLNATFTALHA